MTFFLATARRNGVSVRLFIAHDHKHEEARVMMRKTLTGLAVVAGCLTMAASIPAVQAQMLPPAQVIH